MIFASQLVGIVRIDGAESGTAKLLSVGAASDSTGKKLALLGVGAAAGVGVALAALGAKTVLMAGDFQVQMTKLYTTAGESFKNLTMVGAGILAMAPQVGTSVKALGDAMYWIESSGRHGAAGLAALRLAAEAAKAENANLDDVSKALGASLNAYAGYGLTDAKVMNILTAATGQGMLSFQQLSTSLANVLPASAKFHVSLTDVTAALATMSAQGDKADSAATHLKQMILALEAPSKIGAAAMKLVGLTSQQLADEMTKSLPGAVQMVTDAVGKKFPEGSAAYNQAIKNIAGGNKQMMGFLELSGEHLKTFNDNVATITDHVKLAGNAIMGWSDIQKNFNFKLDAAKASLEAFAIKIGTALLPYVGQFISFLSDKGMPLLSRLSDWVVQIALPAFLKFSDWFANKAIPYMQGLAKTVGDNLLPPLKDLIGNVIGIAKEIGGWVTQSGLLADAVGFLSGLLGTLVSWVSDFIAGLRDGNPYVSALVGLITAVGTAIGLVKLQAFAADLFASFQQLKQGSGIVANLATQAFPQLGQALFQTKTAVTAVGDAATGAEGVTKVAAVGMTAAMGIATLGISAAIGVLVATFMMAKDHITTGAHQMSADVQATYNSLGNTEVDIMAKSAARQVEQAHNTATQTVAIMQNSASRSSAAWISAHQAIAQAADDAKAKVILDQQKIADAAVAAAVRADSAWQKASQDMSLVALLAAAGWTGPQIAAYTGSGYSGQAGPRPGGHAYAEGGPVLQTGLALVHKGEYVIPANALWRPSGGYGGGGAGMSGSSSPSTMQPIILQLDSYQVGRILMPAIVANIRNNLGVNNL